MVRIVDLGLIHYSTALERQEAAAREVEAGGEGWLFLLEHPEVVTFGRHGGEENLLLPEVQLRAQGVEVVRASRGGNVTCHFPGQLVAYPILRLDRRAGGVKRFSRDLESAALSVVQGFGIDASLDPGRPGVWVAGRKISFLGVAVKKWVTRHGLSLNVGMDLSLFSSITPCGLSRIQVTSVSRELDVQVDMKDVKDAFVREFTSRFADA